MELSGSMGLSVLILIVSLKVHLLIIPLHGLSSSHYLESLITYFLYGLSGAMGLSCSMELRFQCLVSLKLCQLINFYNVPWR